MDLSADKVAIILGALATFIPAVLGALKTYRNAGDSDKRLQLLEQWQKEQDKKLGAFQEDQARAFRDQGQSRTELKWLMREVRSQLGEAKQKLQAIPTRSEFNYKKTGESMEFTPLPDVAPRQDPITERHNVDPYPDVDERYKPRRKK